MKKDIDLRRILKGRDDIRKGEAKEREIQEYLKTQRELVRQLENDYIVKKTRELQESGGDVLDILKVTQELILGDEDTEDEPVSAKEMIVQEDGFDE